MIFGIYTDRKVILEASVYIYLHQLLTYIKGTDAMLGFEFIAIGAMTCCFLALVACVSTPNHQTVGGGGNCPHQGRGLIINCGEEMIKPPTYEEATAAPPKFSESMAY